MAAAHEISLAVYGAYSRNVEPTEPLRCDIEPVCQIRCLDFFDIAIQEVFLVGILVESFTREPVRNIGGLVDYCVDHHSIDAVNEPNIFLTDSEEPFLKLGRRSSRLLENQKNRNIRS